MKKKRCWKKNASPAEFSAEKNATFPFPLFVAFIIKYKWIKKQDARGPAGYFPPQISSKKTTGQQIFSLLTLFNIPIYEVCRKFDKNCKKTLNLENFGFFVIFGLNLIFFHLENSHYLFGKAHWTTNSCHSCHVERFQHSNPRSLSKIWQKLHKNVKNRKILEFFLSFLG